MNYYIYNIFTTQVLNWFERNAYCPLCRYDIRTYYQDPEDPLISQQISDISNNSNNYNIRSFTHELASIITDQISQENDSSGNINIEM